MKELVDLEARGRVRRASLLPLNIAVAALTEARRPRRPTSLCGGCGFAELDAVPASSPSRVQFGRCDATSGILTAVHKMPRKWQLELEAEADRAEGVEDLAVTAELEELEEQCNEHADVDLAVELLEAPLPYDAAPEDAAKTSNMQLAPVPALVEQQWKQYAAYRQQPFNRHRSTGAAVEDTTVESDRANALRWLGYLKAEHGQAPSLKLFAHEQVGAWTEAWVLKLRALGLKGSTIAVYVNGVISVSAYACAALAPDGGELCPTHELITLRRQAESISKQERLFEAKHPSWLSWEEAQKARQACVEKYNAATERHEKQRLLKDALALAFHTLQPPVRPELPPVLHARVLASPRVVRPLGRIAWASCAASASATRAARCTRRRARARTRST